MTAGREAGRARGTDRVPIAVVGVSALFPGSADETGFWRDILAGRDLIREVPPSHWLVEDYYDPDPAAPDKTYARRGAFLDPVPFDALAHGVPPAIVPATDTSQLLALIVAQRVLEDAAQGQFAALDRSRVSVILGVTSGQELLSSMASRLQRPVWVKALREAGIPEDQVREACDRIAAHYVPWQESTFPGLLGNVVAGRIANRFDLGGTNCVTDAACASAFAAVSMAVNELRLGQSDLVITGGVDAMNDIFMFMCFSKTPALSRTGDCRPFSDAADGTLLGEGLAMVALKRLEDAQAAGDRIYAVLRGVGSSSDGRARSVYAPRPEGQARAIARAYEDAGYGPETVELVEAHGTGTVAGDAAEFEALASTFDASGRADRQWCALGSVKSQIGHTKAAAGAAGLFKAVMALHHGVLPPTIKAERPDPKLRLEASPFFLSTAARPWVRGSSHPRRASVSSFGFGGSNFHLALEEYRGPGPRPGRLRTAPSELVVFGAPTRAALAAALGAVPACGAGSLAWLARDTQETTPPDAAVRLAIVAKDETDFAAKLAAAAAALGAAPGPGAALPPGVRLGEGGREGGLAFLFPGQGSQYPGMGAACAMLWPEARAVWDLAADLVGEGPVRLQDVVFPRPAHTDGERVAQRALLTRTEWAQPAIAAASLAHRRLLAAVGLRPDCVAGHSLGEVTALAAAGAIDEAGAIAASRRRGELMAEAAREPGAMAAVFAPIEAVQAAITEVPGVVIANHNAPAQAVISGPAAAVAAAAAVLAGRGLKSRRLPVATAFHSPLVAGASGAFGEYLAGAGLRAPAISVYGNADAAPYPRDAGGTERRLAAQLALPVRFVEQIEAMYAAGTRIFVEVGPGAVLTGLVGRILGARPHRALSVDREGADGVTAFHGALAELFAAGCAPDLGALWVSFRRPEDPRAAQPAAVAIPVSGVNCGKPYPPPGGAAALPPPNPARSAETSFACAPGAGTPLAPPAPLHPGGAGSPALEAWERVQRETAEAHAAWQRSMTEAHLAFLKASEQSLAALAAMSEGRTPASPTAPATSPAVIGAPLVAPALVEPGVASPSGDLAGLVREVVAEKTGYPAGMLGMAMALEADLGIDSIKRVEILSALRDRVPGLAEVDPERMAALRTLADVVAACTGMPAASPAPVAGMTSPGDGPGGESLTEFPVVSPAISPVERLALQVIAAAAPGTALPGLAGARRLVVTDDGGGVAEALVAALARRGVAAVPVAAVPEDAAGAIVLAGLRDDGRPGAAAAAVREVFCAARALAPRLTASGGVFVVVQDTGGDFGISGSPRAWMAGIAGIAKTAALEWPAASVKAIDLARAGCDPAQAAETIAAELLGGGAALEVGFPGNGVRVVASLAACAAANGDRPALEPGAVAVATGGGRGVSAACLIALARAVPCRLALLGRTPLAEGPEVCRGATGEAGIRGALYEAARAAGQAPAPAELAAQARAVVAAREVRATLEAIRAAGCEARYEAADVRDAVALGAALARVRSAWGPIEAVVHGAGVVADSLIARKTDAQFDAVYDTKVAGLEALLAATAADPLRAIVLFSSVAARGGNPGQADYAAANEVLNKVAALEARRRGDACLVRALGWGPWDGGMVTPALRAHFAGRGVPLLPVASGAEAFVRELAAVPGGPAEVLITAAAAPRPPMQTFEVTVNEVTHPYLADHRIAGASVLPIVLALELFARAAAAADPGLEVVACRDLRVLKGALLPGFGNGGDRFRVLCGRREPDGLRRELELQGANGVLHYAGAVELGERLPPPGKAPAPLPALASLAGTPYGRELFHGPRFQAIRSLCGVSVEGAAATLEGTRGLGWEGAWRTDAAALDGGLQLAMLWTSRLLGGLALPTAVGAYHAYRAGLFSGPITCTLRGRAAGEARTLCDISFTDADDALLAELRGVEVHRRPGAARP